MGGLKRVKRSDQGLNCNFLYKGTLATFDHGVKPISMPRCTVSLKYDTGKKKF